MGIILFFVLIIIISIFIPEFVLVFIVLNLFFGLFLSIFQIIIALLPDFKPERRNLQTEPFVSILVPAYNEPPTILMQTLDTLAHLEYKNFEVLIIDNNTKDSAIWKPVKIFSQTLGERFHFFHVDPLSGFKAGSLNYLLKRISKKAEYIAVIDADYIVKSDFLLTALSYFSQESIALVQFPQHYRNRNEKNQPIADEYRHFFGIYMNMANHLDCVPSTGTISVYRSKILKLLCGFRGEALTEDADVGLRMYEAGYRGIYVDRLVGYGLMPYDLEAYKHQKWRWAFGNAQSLIKLFSLFGKIPFKSWFGFLLHLTAWDHLNFLPFAVISSYVILLLPFITLTEHHRYLFDIASLSLLITLVSKRILFWASLKNQKKSLRRSWRAFLIHMGMTLVYSEAWLAFLFRTKSVFERTNKFILLKMPSLFKNTYKELVLGVWFLIGIVEVFYVGERITTQITFFIAAMVLFCIFYVYWKIASTKEYSKKLLRVMEKKYEPYLINIETLKNKI
ncbi:MAG: glycosyltransferase [Candidatus Moraniibacteriota bacterium]|nr:MAG: glycosyltransferase [Candidatus Moranbacteria bacterium]